MDDNTFAILALALGTAIVCVIIWQILAVARARAESGATQEQRQWAHNVDAQCTHLDQRVTALAEDLEELDRRVTALDRPSRS